MSHMPIYPLYKYTCSNCNRRYDTHKPIQQCIFCKSEKLTGKKISKEGPDESGNSV